MNAFLGIDGGGTKTDFLLIDGAGSVLARQRRGSAYHLEIGIDALRKMLVGGIRDTLAAAAIAPTDITCSFLGLPAYGENETMRPELDRIADEILPVGRYYCANDVVCGWAGALAGNHGIAVIAGTGSIAYGEFGQRSARAGGWGELFGDEGSAFWIARQLLTLFSQMSDGRIGKGELYGLVRDHFEVSSDLEICGAVSGPPALTRSELAALCRLAEEAARRGDPAAVDMFIQGAQELAALVHAVRGALHVAADASVPVSYCGGLLRPDSVLLPLFETALRARALPYELFPPHMLPSAGAASRAAALAHTPLSIDAISRLAGACPAHSVEGLA